MADISKINGVPIANIEKLDAVLAANIAKVNGLVFSTAAAFLLDTYTGAAAAYSVRKLKTGVTVAARIRRSGDDIEADVEFDSNNEISLTSPISNASSGTYTDLADFVDHTGTPRDAFCVEWKDQSGSGNHATQQTAGGSGLQPQLYDATTGLFIDNGKPSLNFDGSNDQLDFAATWNANFYYSAFAVRTGQSTTNSIFIGCPDTSTYYADISTSQTTEYILQNGFNGLNQTNDWTLFRKNGAAAFSGATSRADFRAAFYDGNQVLESFLTAGSPYANVQFTSLRIGGYTSAGYNYDGTVQEFIMYQSTTSNQSSNASGIETNINSEYLIYQPTDAPTSGLLATYTGAAAAYSVRQLSDKAVIALRIRRDSDDEEINIGFDANGDLDTTAISDFCSTANGYVTRWWDQSTNGRHIDQQIGGASSLQPQIYNGTAVITDGTSSIPAIYFDGSNALGSSSFTTVSQPLTVFHSLTLTQAFGTTKYIWSLQGFSGGVNNMADNGTKWKYWYGGSLDRNVGTSGIGQHLLTSLADGTDSTVWENGTMVVDGRQDSGSVGMDQIYLGGWNSTTNQFDGYINEWIIYPTDQDAAGNRSGIEQNIDNYFQIT